MTVLTLDNEHRKQLIALAAIPDPEANEPRDGIRFAGKQAVALDTAAVGVVGLPWGVEEPRILPARPLAAALKMAGKDDLVRITFGERQAVVTVGSPTLSLDDPDDEEGLPPVAVDLTYLDDEDWPGDLVHALQDRTYGDPGEYAHHIFDADRLLKVAKLGGSGEVRIEAPAAGAGAWRVTTPYSRRPLGFLMVTRVGAHLEDGDAA